MKSIKKLLYGIITFLMLIPGVVFAASASFSVSAPNQGVVGNQLTVTVTVSSSQSLGGWELALNYDKSYLQLSSAPEGANGTHVAGNANSSGTKSKSYTYRFKVLKSGTTTISTTSTDAYGWDESTLSCSNGSKKIVLKTQAEIEASYSANDNLKSLGVDGYSISPSFDKNTLEYSLEVENDVEKVNITAAKEDGTASISGIGEKALAEGGNKFDIVVTAQKGNSKTYTINITRKELNPITVNVKNKTYTLVRKKDLLPDLTTFVETTLNYDGEEVPGLVNNTINYNLIGLKDDEGNVKLFVYNDNKITDEYFELTTGNITILPTSIDQITGLTKKELDIKGYIITGYTLSNSNSYIIKGINVYDGKESYYMYDKVNGIFIAYDKTNIEQLMKKYNMFKLGGIILCIVVVLLVLLIVIVKLRGKKKRVKDGKVDTLDEVVDEVVEEIQLETEEIPTEEEVKVEEVKEEPQEEVKEEKLSKKAQKKLVKEEKRKKREQEEIERTKELEAIKEEPVEEKEEVIEEEEIEDPLNDDDNFVDFWETKEYKLKNKKKKD